MQIVIYDSLLTILSMSDASMGAAICMSVMYFIVHCTSVINLILIDIIVMAECRTVVSPVLMHWRYGSLALSHWFHLVKLNMETVLPLTRWSLMSYTTATQNVIFSKLLQLLKMVCKLSVKFRTDQHQWWVNSYSGSGLLPDWPKPLPGPMLTAIRDAAWYHQRPAS